MGATAVLCGRQTDRQYNAHKSRQVQGECKCVCKYQKWMGDHGRAGALDVHSHMNLHGGKNKNQARRVYYVGRAPQRSSPRGFGSSSLG